MRDKESRSFVEHHKSLFDIDLLRALHQELEASHRQRQADAVGERELRAVERGEGSDALRMDPRWFDVWRRPSLALLDVVRPFSWVVYPPQVRRVSHSQQHVPWHQDIAYQRLLAERAHAQIITCFIPLDEDPSRRTTIQFAPLVLDEARHEPGAGFGARWPHGDPEQQDHFELSLGDALVFGDLILHRTYTPPGANPERSSLEFRLVAPAGALETKDYFDIEAGCFTRKDGSRRDRP